MERNLSNSYTSIPVLKLSHTNTDGYRSSVLGELVWGEMGGEVPFGYVVQFYIKYKLAEMHLESRIQ